MRRRAKIRKQAMLLWCYPSVMVCFDLINTTQVFNQMESLSHHDAETGAGIDTLTPILRSVRLIVEIPSPHNVQSLHEPARRSLSKDSNLYTSTLSPGSHARCVLCVCVTESHYLREALCPTRDLWCSLATPFTFR